MFSKVFSALLMVSTLAAGVTSKPIPNKRAALSRRSDSLSFDNWGGFSSLDNFDNFYGSGNFDGSQHFSQTVVSEVVCHTQQIEIIQQRLLVLQEMAKRIITEQVCDVETQVIVFEQYYSSLGGFSHDLRRNSGHQVGYDSHISGYYPYMYNYDGSLTTNDWGFTGSDNGGYTVVGSGSNWVDSTSPTSVSNAYSAAWGAYSSLHPDYTTSDYGSSGMPVISSGSSTSGGYVPVSVDPSSDGASVAVTPAAVNPSSS